VVREMNFAGPTKSSILRNIRGPIIGLHLSAGKPKQRWPVERFVDLAKRIISEYNAHILLFWAPGAENHPLDPGDNEKASRFIQ
jgi:heptosyltransferase-3